MPETPILIVDEPLSARPASTFLNYKGDLTKSNLLGSLLGPAYRERTTCLRVVSVDHDPAKDQTRAGCVYEQLHIGVPSAFGGAS